MLRVDLRSALALIGSGFGLVGWALFKRLDDGARSHLGRRVLIGVPVGIISTLAYDGSKWLFAAVSGGREPVCGDPKIRGASGGGGSVDRVDHRKPVWGFT